MSKKRGSHEPDGLTVHYKQLGTVSMEELAHALIEDIKSIENLYNVRFVTGGYLKLYVTNEYGDKLPVRRPEGGKVSFIDTFHFKPACKDYEL